MNCCPEMGDSAEEKIFSKIEAVKSTRVLPEGTSAEEGELQLQLEDKWLINPKLLLVGPKIGEGAHAIVHKGKYKEKIVAIKIIQRGDSTEERGKRERRFAREVTFLSRVQHKNLVKFIGAFKNSEMMVVVTELLVGGSLRKYLMDLRPKCIDIHTALSFALDIAQAMECLHKNGIIHRDLKPDNLLLTADQKKVKLADFGLAREETLTEMMTAETGTYRWMAPELYSTVTLKRGEKKHYDHKVDVYSFSIVLWELLTNRMPFEGMSNLQAAYAAAFKNARPSVENISEELAFILRCCWAEDPNLRPNFSQIVRMLSASLSSLPASESMQPPPSSLPASESMQPPSQQTVASRDFLPPARSPGASSLGESQTDSQSNLGNSPRRLMFCFKNCLGR